MKHPIAITQNGIAVYVDLVKSQAAAHIAQQPHLLALVKEVVEQTTTNASEIHLEQNMGRTIGYSIVVETTEKDTVLYARLLRDELYTRFVKNGKPITTQYLSIILRRDSDDSYELYDTWIGRLTPPRPGSEKENAQSKPFWESHAFIFEGQSIQLATTTKECPY
jgi:hypothetical protein